MALHLFHIETLNQIKTFDAYSIKKHVIEKVSLFSPVTIFTSILFTPWLRCSFLLNGNEGHIVIREESFKIQNKIVTLVDAIRRRSVGRRSSSSSSSSRANTRLKVK